MQYTRRDVAVTVTSREHTATVRFGRSAAVELDLGDIEQSPVLTLPEALFQPRRQQPEPHVVDRFVLDVPPDLAHLGWEAAFAGRTEGRIVVRSSGAPPTTFNRPLALPLRLALVGPSAGLAAAIRRTASQLHVDTVAVTQTSMKNLDADVSRLRWPTIDVLHIDDPTFDRMLRRAVPGARSEQNALAVIERLCGWYQVRLITLVTSVGLGDAARRLASSAVDRGGPAVVCVPRAAARRPIAASADRDSARDATRPAVSRFYDDIISDLPIDVAAANLGTATIFVGAGREDSVRLSAGARRVVETAQVKPRWKPISVKRRNPPIEFSDFASAHHLRSIERLDRFWIGADVSRIAQNWSRAEPAMLSEADTVRLTRELSTLERVVRRGRDQDMHGERYVNGVLLDSITGAPIEANDPPLRVGATYMLYVDVGPLIQRFQASHATQFIVDDTLWDSAGGPLLAELVVSGHGFDILGSAVQPMWIPRVGPSAPRLVAVRATVAGAASMRYTIYVGNQVVQSFRLVAVARRGEGPASSRAWRDMARILEIPMTKLGRRPWQTRLEYSTVATVDEIGELPARSFSLVVNDTLQKPTIVVKGTPGVTVSTPGNLDDYVLRLREEINAISGATSNDYYFGVGDDLNAGAAERFGKIMARLAGAGWEIYNVLFTYEDAETLERFTREPGTVSVAHVLRDKVIPWAFIYDLPCDITLGGDDGDVDHVACLASLPGGDGRLPVAACASSSACELHPDRLAARAAAGKKPVVRESVVCPLGFWGVRHRIEVPARQVGVGAQPGDSTNEIGDGKACHVAIVMNATLVTTKDHRDDLRRVIAAVPDAAIELDATRRDAVVRGLRSPDLDIVYAFCHANGGPKGPVPPELVFQELDQPARSVTPAQLGRVRWIRHPLVFLNGCGTTGFSPRATSEFIDAFVDKRGAGGVIGADVPVHEHLASEVGRAVIEAVLDGQQVGIALEHARRSLLRRLNPLGLVYTLYGSLELARRAPE